MHLDQSAFPGQEQAIDEIVTLALQIAKRQRGEDHLQSAESIKGKLLLEYVELGEALAVKTRLDVLSEVADCTYYTVCLFAINHSEHNLHAVQTFVCQQASATVEQAYQAALAKYRYRSNHPKNIPAENEEIRQALGN